MENSQFRSLIRVTQVEGGLIDQAHHNNWARLALTEAVGMEAAVEAVLKMTSRKDTLVVVTADHSHTMTINGYASRGNDILGEKLIKVDIYTIEVC
jgi:alkaline phosphatase